MYKDISSSPRWRISVETFRKTCHEQQNIFIQDCLSPRIVQQNILEKLIQLTKNTAFGQEYGMQSIHSLNDYCRQVPIRSYDKYVPWLEQEITQHGGVLTNSKVIRWLKTSGTTGMPKKIPYTEHWMSQYRVPAMYAMWGTYLQYCPTMLHHPCAVLDMQSTREPVREFLNGIPYQSITNRHPPLNEFDWQPPWYHAPWYLPDPANDYDTKMYTRLRYLLTQDVRMITAVNPSTLISLHYHLNKNLAKLIEDIYNGELNSLKITEPDPKSAKWLERLATRDHYHFKDIWPNLSLISCWTAASAKLYQTQIKQLFPEVKIIPFMTCGTEGVVTLPVDDHSCTGPLAINQAIFEFLPTSVDFDKIIHAGFYQDTLRFNELELDREYYLIMSQLNGLYRYATGDVYKVIDFYHDVPRIEFVRRQGTYHSFTGEKLTEAQIILAIKSTYQIHHAELGLFICSPTWGNPPSYKLLVEMKDPDHCPERQNTFAEKFDQALRGINTEYNSKRETNRLGPVEVILIREGTITNYLERIKAKGNAIQFKYKPLQANNDLTNELLAISR